MLIQANFNNSHSGLRRGGIHNRQALERRSVEPPVPGQKSIGLAQGMGADQEISRPAGSLPALLPVGLPGLAGLQRSFQGEGAEINSQTLHGFACVCGRGEKGCDFGPNHLAGHQPPLGNTGTHRLAGARPESGVSAEKIEQHARINRGNHSLSFAPRSPAISWSVGRRRSRIPKTASTESRESDFASTSRPRSSRTFRTCRGLIPRRKRRGLGIVTAECRRATERGKT